MPSHRLSNKPLLFPIQRTVLFSFVALVVSATLVDLNQVCGHEDQAPSNKVAAADSDYSPSSTFMSEIDMIDNEDAEESQQSARQCPRDQRSPSLSSSDNSIASSTAPILAKYHQQRKQQQQQQNALDRSQQQQQAQDNSGYLLKQIFLAFSLRHSAALIFTGDDSKRGREPSTFKRARRSYRKVNFVISQQQQAGYMQCHRSRVSSLGSINESIKLPDEPHEQAGRQQATSDQNEESHVESIDSLHGLRFLSMIWIIVIHSYNFALRWSFFDQSASSLAGDSSLSSLYKTSASQLLANGTFACDSFFFIGGFLLPYLAFPSQQQQQLSKQQQQQQHSQPAARALAAQHPISFQFQKGAKQSAAASGKQATKNNSIEEGNANGIQASESRLAAAPQMQITSTHNGASQLTVIARQRAKPAAEFTFGTVLANLLHRYIRMMPLMMAIIGLSATLLRYLGEGQQWDNSTIMFDKWCRDNWWINLLFLHNFLKRENMCLSHSWYSAVDIQLFLLGQLLIWVLYKNRKLGLSLVVFFLVMGQSITGALTMIYHLPAVPLISNVSESLTNLYYGEIYIKPYCRASPYLIGILLAYLMRTTRLGQLRLSKAQAALGWLVSLSTIFLILMAMKPAMNGKAPSEWESALYSSLSRPLWACATGWMIFACMTQNGFIFGHILSAKLFIPLSRLTYPAFLIHPIVMAVFYGSHGGDQSAFQFSHYLMLYLILGNIVITYASAFVLSTLFELPLLSVERVVKRAWAARS